MRQNLTGTIHTLGVLQVYAYLVGWWQYDLFYQVLREFGIFYIPIAFVVGRAVLVPFLSQETRSAAVTAVKRMGISFLALFFMMLLFVVPSVPFSISSVVYKKDGSSYFAGKGGGTTYSHFFDSSKLPKIEGAAFDGVQIPIGWYAIIEIMNSITAIGFDSLSDGNVSARNVSEQMSYAAIQDPRLKAEISNFQRDCYQKAYADYIGGQDDISLRNRSAIDKEVKKYGQDDLGWIGSHVLLKYYYPTYQARDVVPGFVFDKDRDFIEGQYQNHSKDGKPTCSQWWTGQSVAFDPGAKGLRDKLSDALDKQIKLQGKWYNVEAWMHNHYSWVDSWKGFTQDDMKDAAIHVMLEKQLHAESSYNTAYYTEDATRGGMTSSFGRGLATVGTIVDYNTTWSAYIDTFIKMLPVIQAGLIAMLLAFLPFGAVISCFAWRFMFTAIFMMFALIFCTYEWHFVAWFDNLLTTSLYHSDGTGFDSVTDTMRRYFSANVNPGRIILDMGISLMYVVFPMVVSSLMAAAGFQIGGALDKSIGSAGSQSRETANKGMSVFKQTMGSAVGKYSAAKRKEK